MHQCRARTAPHSQGRRNALLPPLPPPPPASPASVAAAPSPSLKRGLEGPSPSPEAARSALARPLGSSLCPAWSRKSTEARPAPAADNCPRQANEARAQRESGGGPAHNGAKTRKKQNNKK